MSLKKIHIFLGLGFLVMAGTLVTSYMHDSLFLDRLLVAGGILSCIMFIKALGNS